MVGYIVIFFKIKFFKIPTIKIIYNIIAIDNCHFGCNTINRITIFSFTLMKAEVYTAAETSVSYVYIYIFFKVGILKNFMSMAYSAVNLLYKHA